MFDKLFQPVYIGTVLIPNRIAMDPLQNYLAGTNGECTPKDVAFYAARAKGGAGLITTGTVCVDLETGRANRHVLAIDRDDLIPGFAKLADAVHRYGSVIFAELYHPGRQGLSSLNGNRPMMAPSVTMCPVMKQETREMSVAEVMCMIRKFADAALRCKEAGIDGVTLHCAHGYLLEQFLSPYTNHRNDEYGGSDENRARIVCEIIKAIKDKCGSYPVSVRISADEFLDEIGHDRNEGITLELSCRYAKMFEAAGADAIDVSAGFYETMNTSWEPNGYEQGWKAYLAAGIRKAVSVPVIATANVREPEYAEGLIENGTCDLVGSARVFLAEPEWANKIHSGRLDEICPCISCLNCFKTLFASTAASEDGPYSGAFCAVNSKACRELEYGSLPMDGQGRCVVIVGAGIAGLEAACVLAERRFKPVILERDKTIGGQINLAGRLPDKEVLSKLLKYYENRCKKMRIEIITGVEATADIIAGYKPAAVVLATGSDPAMPESIPGIKGQNVYSIPDTINNMNEVKGKRVIVVGTGMAGLEMASMLADNGCHVDIFEKNPYVGNGTYFQNLNDVMGRLILKDVSFNVGCTLKSISESGCIFDKNGAELKASADAVVVALGSVPRKDLVSSCKARFEHVYTCGDARMIRDIAGNTMCGYYTGARLQA